MQFVVKISWYFLSLKNFIWTINFDYLFSSLSTFWFTLRLSYYCLVFVIELCIWKISQFFIIFLIFFNNTLVKIRSGQKTYWLRSSLMVNLVFCYKNCSSDRDFFFKFEAEGQEFAKFLRSLEQFIQIVKGQKNFAFLSGSFSYLIN